VLLCGESTEEVLLTRAQGSKTQQCVETLREEAALNGHRVRWCGGLCWEMVRLLAAAQGNGLVLPNCVEAVDGAMDSVRVW